MKRILWIVVVLVIAVVCVRPTQAADVATTATATPAPLQLVGVEGGHEFRDFAVSHGKIVLREGKRTSPLPAGIRWRVDGDLGVDADHMMLRLDHKIVTRPARVTSQRAQALNYAIMGVGRGQGWKNLKGAILVFLWIADGRQIWSDAKPVVPNESPSADIAAIDAVELDADGVRGTPVALAFKNGKLLLPQLELKYTGTIPSLLTKTAADSTDPLSLAVEIGDMSQITLLSAKVGPNWALGLRRDLLADGLTYGDPVLTRSLLGAGMKADDAVEGIPLLVTAAKAGNAESVGLLLQAGAKVDLAAHDGTTALMGAVCSGDRDAVEVVLNAGAILSAQDGRGRTAMDRAADMQRQDLLDLLRVHGAAPTKAPLRATDRRRAGPGSDDCCCQFAGQPIFAAGDVNVLPVAKVVPSPGLIWSSLLTTTTTMPDRPSVRVAGNPRTGEIIEYQERPRNSESTTTSSPRTDHWGVATLVVEPDGTPSSIRIIAANPDGFGGELEKVLPRYEFTPGLKDGHPVRARMTLVITIPN